MKRNLLVLVVLLSVLVLFPEVGSCQFVVTDFKLSSDVILPGDTVEGYLEIQNKGSSTEQLNDIMLFYDKSVVTIEPDYLSNVGVIPPSASYTYHFTVFAKKAGITKVNVWIRSEAKWIKYTFNIIVRKLYPRIIINETIILNEVNKVHFYVFSPVDIKNIVIKPLFDAEPKEIYLEGNSGYFTFTPRKEQPLKFKIMFYLDKNYHEVVQEVYPKYKESMGLGVNVSLSYTNVVLGDVVEVYLTLVNLRDDDIYFLKILPVAKEGIFHSESEEIPVLSSRESKTIKFLYSPTESGKNLLFFDICYKDRTNELFYVTKLVYIYVSNEYQVALTNLNVETGSVIKIRGDVSNQGRSKVYNVLVELNTGDEAKNYFIGSIDPSDFESFEFELKKNVSKAELRVIWTNELGEKYEFKKKVTIMKLPVKRKSPEFMTAALAFSIGIFALLSAIWIKRLWRKKK